MSQRYPAPQTPPKRILVMRYRFIGDTLLTVPFLRNLRRAYPDAVIDMLVGPNSGELLTHCPYVNELIYFDTTRKHGYENLTGFQKRRKTFWHYVQHLKKRNYDTAFILKRSFSSAGLAFLAGIPNRIGFNTEYRGFLLTHTVPYQKKQHEVESFLDVLRAVGIPVTDNYLEAWPQKENPKNQEYEKLIQSIENNNTQNIKQILVHLTASRPAKCWPKENAIGLVHWLIEEYQAQIHFVGAPQDRHVYDELMVQIPPSLRSNIHNHCGKTNLLESLRIIEKMDLVIGVDTGTLHMAAAVNVPVIGLFGPMDEIKWGPFENDPQKPIHQVLTEPVSCRPCNLKISCQDKFDCMTQLSLEKVQSAVRKTFGAGNIQRKAQRLCPMP